MLVLERYGIQWCLFREEGLSYLNRCCVFLKMNLFDGYECIENGFLGNEFLENEVVSIECNCLI